MATLHLLSGDTVHALDWLDAAFDERTPSLIHIRREPACERLRGNLRFERIVAAMNFPR